MNRYALNKAVFKGLRATGVVRATQWLTRASPRIFMYHRFGPSSDGKRLGVQDFERQLIELKARFRLMTFGDLATILASGQQVPPYSAVITVDDGYADFYEYAFPVLRKVGVPASLYVTTGFVDRELWLWPDQLEYVLKSTEERSLKCHIAGQGFDLPLQSAIERKQAWGKLVPVLLGMPNEEMRGAIEMLSQHLRVPLTSDQPAEYAAANWDQLKELSQAGIEIGPHTRTHPSLTRIPEAQLQEEIAGSKRRVEEMLGTHCRTFCYPNGTPDDVNERIKEVVTEAGFLAAAVAYFDRGVLRDTLEVRRYPVGDSAFEFAKCTSGLRYLLSKDLNRTAVNPAYAT